MPIPKATLNFPFNADLPFVYCPVCGSLVQRPDDETELPPCQHLELAYLDIIDEFLYLDPNLELLLEKWEKEADANGDDFDPHDALEALGKNLDGGTRLLISIETSGMGCGPSGSTVVYGFNFMPQTDQNK